MCEFFDGCGHGHGAKAAPGRLPALAPGMGVDASEIAVAVDAVHDLEMGHRAGAGLKIAVLSGTGRYADLAPMADVVLDSLRELPAALQP